MSTLEIDLLQDFDSLFSGNEKELKFRSIKYFCFLSYEIMSAQINEFQPASSSLQPA